MSSDRPSPGRSTNPIDLTSSPSLPIRTIDLTNSSPQLAPHGTSQDAVSSNLVRKPLPVPPYRSMLDIGPELDLSPANPSTISRSQSHHVGERDPRLARRYLRHYTSSTGLPASSRPEVRTAARQHSRSSPAVPVLPLGTRPPHNTVAARQDDRPSLFGAPQGITPALWDEDATPRTFEEMMQQAEAGYRRRRGTGSTGGNDRSMARRQSIRAPWQPDEEAIQCARCNRPFSLLNRRHHCRKCGLVVCSNCSTHRITMPRKYISQPSEYIDSGSDRDDLSVGDELETVRVCDPCVPDPNYGLPPQMPGMFMPAPNPMIPLGRQFPSPQSGVNSATMPQQTVVSGTGGSQSRRGTMPSYPAGIFDMGPPPANRTASLSQSHQPSTRPAFPSHQQILEWQMHGVRTLQHSPQRPSSPPRPKVYPNMAVYKASEKDARAANEGEDPPECVICLGEFEVGEDLALLECFCKFHRDCIVGWWDKDGTASCPTHKLRED